MKSTKRTIGALILIAAALAVPATAQETTATSENAESVSGTYTANSLLKIVTEPGVISLSDNTIGYLLQSSHVRGDAIAKVLGSTSEALQTRIRTNVLEVAEIEGPPKERSILLSLDIELEQGAKPAAKELMEALVANFRKALETAYQSEFRRLDEQTSAIRQEAESAERQLVEVQYQLMKFSDRDLSGEALRSSITAILSQLEGLRLEKASQEAYRQSVLSRISEIQKELDRTLHDDVISVELDQILQRRMAELKNTRGKVEAGLASSMEVAAMEDKLAAARIDLARRREELGKTGSGAGLGQLTAELTTLTLEAGRTQAKEDHLMRQFEETRALLARSGDYERMNLRLEIAKQNLQEAETSLNRARQRLGMLQRPSISVIGD